MRLALLLLLPLALGACVTSAPPLTPAEWAAIADVLGSEEYAETFLDELDDRLDDADADLTRDQRRALYAVLYDGAERHHAIAERFRDTGPSQRAEAERAFAASSARTDAAAEALLTSAQVPIYRALQAEARAALAREVTGP